MVNPPRAGGRVSRRRRMLALLAAGAMIACLVLAWRAVEAARWLSRPEDLASAARGTESPLTGAVLTFGTAGEEIKKMVKQQWDTLQRFRANEGKNRTRGQLMTRPLRNVNLPDIIGVVPESMRRNDADAKNMSAQQRMYSRDPRSPAARRYTTAELNEMASGYDIVYTWVNGSERVHLHRKADAKGRESMPITSRDRDSGELRASLRSLVANMPWHKGRITIVSPGHVPTWLSLTNARISVVHQDALTDDDEHKYTANTNSIEPNLHRLPGLTKQFVQFNDDCFVARKVDANALFDPHGGGPALLFEPNLIGGGEKNAQTLKATKKVWLASVYTTNGELDKAFGRTRRWFIKHAPFSMCRDVAEGVYALWRSHFQSRAPQNKYRGHDDVLFPFLHHYVALEGPDLAYNAIRKASQARDAAAGGHGDDVDLSSLGCPPAVGKVGRSANASLLVLRDREGIDKVIANRDAVESAFITVNDGFRNASLSVVLSDFLAKWFPIPSHWERQSERSKSRLTGPLMIAMVATSCEDACAAVRSAASFGFSQHDAAATKMVLAMPSDGVATCGPCRGGKQSKEFLDRTFTFRRDTVAVVKTMLEAKALAASNGTALLDLLRHVLLAGCGPGLPRSCWPAGLTQRPSTAVLITAPNPLFGEAVMDRHLLATDCHHESAATHSEATHAAAGDSGCFELDVQPRPAVGHAPSNARAVLRLSEEVPHRSYLFTYPLPHVGSVFEVPAK
jgi:hypothetical protein